MRLIDADSLDETITRLNEQDWGITRNEYKLIDRVIFEMPTVDVLEQIRAEIKKEYEDNVGWCGDNDLYTLGLKKALEIIDRHIETNPQ